MNKMKITLLILILPVLILPFSARASTGIGIIVGEPTGLSIKINNFPVLGIAWSLDDYIHLHCDYWLKSGKLERSLYWFFGVGVKVVIKDKKEDDNFGMGMRIPLGLRYFLARRVELFGELAPGLMVLPGTDFNIDAGIGLRFYFK